MPCCLLFEELLSQNFPIWDFSHLVGGWKKALGTPARKKSPGAAAGAGRVPEERNTGKGLDMQIDYI
jgi:hypothetical protein